MTTDTTMNMALYEKRKKGLGRARTQAEKALAMVKGQDITTPEHYEQAGRQILQAKEREALIKDVREETYVPLMRGVKLIGSEFKKATDAWAAVTNELNDQRVAYKNEQERAQKERVKEVRRLQEEAAVRDRAEAEREAEAAEERKDKALAAELRAEAAKPFIPVPVAAITPPKTEGLQDKKTFKARIVNLNEVPNEYIEKKPLMSVLHGLARAAGKKYEGDVDKANIDAPAGVVFYSSSTPARSS